MIDIKPINSIFYNQKKVNINEVIAPPYDVIDKNYQQKLYDRNEFNIVRLILNNNNDPYQNAKECFYDWLNKEVLVYNDKPCILYLIQKYKDNNGKTIQRKGFIARNQIQDFSEKNILPHEYTMQNAKDDRLKLVSSTGAFFSQIFMVYDDKTQTIEKEVYAKYEKQPPFIDVIDDNGVENIVYLIENEDDIKIIQNVLSDKKLLIADGHHRYETSMKYSKLHPDNDYAKYVMSYFTNAADENLIIYPTHRIIEKTLDKQTILEKVSKYYDVEILQDKDTFLSKIEQENQKQITTGLIIKNDNNFYILKLKNGVKEKVKAPKELQNLDLMVLHELILKNEFGYTNEELMSQTQIKYEKQEHVAFNSIKNNASACFIMAYPKMETILNISEQGYRMPQKSTYFYPKLLSGIVINLLENKGEC